MFLLELEAVSVVCLDIWLILVFVSGFCFSKLVCFVYLIFRFLSRRILVVSTRHIFQWGLFSVMPESARLGMLCWVIDRLPFLFSTRRESRVGTV